jgi:hypothetical protein
MSIQEWGAISEMVGAIAIVVSLIYVGVQIRQNTQATRVRASQAFVESHCGAITQITRDSAFWDVYWRGLGGLSNLQGGELAAFGAWIGHTLRVDESFYFQWKAGAFEDQIWSGFKHQFRDLFGYPGVQEEWKIRRDYFSDEFREFVERELIGKASHPLYRIDDGAHVQGKR